MTQQAAFMESISPHIGHSLDASYFHIPETTWKTVRGKGCTFQLDEDGSCTLKVPKSTSRYGDWSGSFASYQGTWEGSWDPKSRELRLDGFPGGESWTIKGVESYTSGKKEQYLDIEAADSDSKSSFSLRL